MRHLVLHVDEASTLALIRAFKQAADDQNAARNTVDGIASNLAGSWGGIASGNFGNGLSAWMNGLMRVHQALQLIDEAMVTFARDTDNTEDDNIALAAFNLTNDNWPMAVPGETTGPLVPLVPNTGLYPGTPSIPTNASWT